MKKYQPKTNHYRELLVACGQELRTLGYATNTAKLCGTGEFLQRMEMVGKLRLDQVEREDIKAHHEHLLARPQVQGGTLSGYTINGYFFSLKLLFDYAERHGLTGGSPLAGFRLPPLPKTQRRLLSREEISLLYAACEDDRQRAILHLLYGCGLRRMEAERLSLRDVDYRSALLYVRKGKGRKRRVIPLGSQVVAGLKVYVQEGRPEWQNRLSGGAYLLNDRGRRMRGNTINKHVKELVRVAELGEGISPHVLRHAIATHLLEQGMKIERVRDFLGHGHLETTQLYTHVKTENL
jgi:integrase/recombinase XerD